MHIKLANVPSVLDHYDDGGRVFMAALAGREPPECIKVAVDLTEVTAAEDDYALVLQTERGLVGKFPIVDAGNALASAIYYEKVAELLPDDVRADVASRLVAALTEFHLQVPASFLQDAQRQTKEASLESVFSKMLGERAPDVEELFASGSPRERREAAIALQQDGVELPVKLAHYTAREMGTDVEFGIDCRIRHLTLEYREPLEQLKKIARAQPPEELAELLQDLDYETGLALRYDRDVPDAYATVYGRQVKQASAVKRASLEIGGRAIPADRIEQFLRGKPEQVAQAFGEDVANQLAENPVEVLSSLPEPHRMAIARMI